MAKFPSPIENLISQFSSLPGVGRKTAERYVFYLLKKSKTDIENFAQTLTGLHNNLKLCSQCGNFTQQDNLCLICADTKRDPSLLCIVEESHDLIVIESTNEYNGLYHVLGGTLNPIEGITEENLNIKKLVDRLQTKNIKEVIFAFNPDMQGEATIIYLKKILQPFNLKITRLARGLPMGSDIEYADEVTLSSALKGRKEVN